MIAKDSPLDRLVRVHKALGHPFRLRILAMLADGELCVCQITATLHLAPSTVSAHLSELKDAGLVLEEKDGRWVRYRLANDPETGRLLSSLPKGLRADARVDEDRRLLRDLRKIPLEKLCRADLDLAKLGLRLGSASGAPGACSRRATNGSRGRGTCREAVRTRSRRRG